MFQKVARGWSLQMQSVGRCNKRMKTTHITRITLETVGNELLEEFTKVSLQGRWGIFRDKEKHLEIMLVPFLRWPKRSIYLHRMQLGVGWFSSRKLNSGYPQAPYVGLVIIATLLNDLG